MTANADKEALDRARDKIEKSGVDALTMESMSRALSLSEDALKDATAFQKPSMKAQHALTLAISHFIAGSPKAAAEIALAIAKEVVKAQYENCRQGTAGPGMTKLVVIRDITKAAAWPGCVAIAIIAVVLILQPQIADVVASTIKR